MKRLFKKIREKLAELTSPKKKTARPKNEPVKDKNWDKRKNELLSKTRGTADKRNETAPVKQAQKPSSKQAPAKQQPRQQQARPQQPRQQRPVQQKPQTEPAPKKNIQTDRPARPKPVKPQQHGERIIKQTPKLPEEKWDSSVFVVEPAEGKTRFHDFDLPVEVMHGIYELGFKYCTPIQAEILSKTLAGKDASGKAQTGTGKTAAFLITLFTNFLKKPLEERKTGSPRALIMAPTRELVMQIANDAKVLSKYTGINVLTIVGGIDYQKQRRSLTGIIDIVVATPGRLLDFYNKRGINLREIEILVIDEADRMMDMGFIPDMRKIIRATPHKDKRQTLLFSATLPPEVIRLASSWTKDSEVVDVEPDHVEGKNVEQITYIISGDEKYPLLYNTIVKKNLNRVIVFTNRRDEAKKLKDLLYGNGLNTEVLSGDVDQRKRMKTLTDFKEGKINILVATDVAGRGIHIEGISHVINYNLPEDPEDYVHRIGRTGRAGAAGISISFACEDDSFQIPAIEKYLGHKLEFTHPDDSLLTPPPAAVKTVEPGEEKPPRQYQERKKPGYRRNNYNRHGGNNNFRRKKEGEGGSGSSSNEKPAE